MAPIVCHRRATGPLGHLTPCLHIQAGYGIAGRRLPRSPHCGLPLLLPDADEQAFLAALDALAPPPVVTTEPVALNVPWELVRVTFDQNPEWLKQWHRLRMLGLAPTDLGVLFGWTISASNQGLRFETKTVRRVA